MPSYQPVPPPAPYRAPVSKPLTLKIMAVLMLFMLVGTLGMLGLGALAQLARNSFTYNTLKSYDTPVYHIDIPDGWSKGAKKDRTGYTQISFYDGLAGEDTVDYRANLELTITLNTYAGLVNDRSALGQIQARSTATLEHRLQDYETKLHCQPGKSSSKVELAGDDLLGYAVLLTCKTDTRTLRLYGRYAVNRRGDLIVEILHTTPEIWERHRALLMTSLRSVRVLI